MEGVFPGKAKIFDTPGLLHPHQISTRLTSEEQKLIRIDKELKPRTCRIKAGYSVHIGGLFRLDVEESSVESIYVSDSFAYGMDRECMHNVGSTLWPSVAASYRERDQMWDSSSIDIAASGLGWFAVGLKGEAVLAAWTYEGVEVIARNHLLPQRAKILKLQDLQCRRLFRKLIELEASRVQRRGRAVARLMQNLLRPPRLCRVSMKIRIRIRWQQFPCLNAECYRG